MKLLGLFFNILVGVPGGMLIFMGMLMFNAVWNIFMPTDQWIMLFLLCITSLVVGILARLTRPFHAYGTALASGVVAALVILYLSLATSSGAGLDLVFGPLGMFISIGFCLLGAWLLLYLREEPKTSPGKPAE
jgi:hypothetical protein